MRVHRALFGVFQLVIKEALTGFNIESHACRLSIATILLAVFSLIFSYLLNNIYQG